MKGGDLNTNKKERRKREGGRKAERKKKRRGLGTAKTNTWGKKSFCIKGTVKSININSISFDGEDLLSWRVKLLRNIILLQIFLVPLNNLGLSKEVSCCLIIYEIEFFSLQNCCTNIKQK